MKQPIPMYRTIDTASSKDEYFTAKKSEGIPSFTEVPCGEERSKIRRIANHP